MNDFNDYSNENQTEYVNDETSRSGGGWGLGLLIIALLVAGLIWFFLSGSAPALSPDIRVLTQYEDDFVFGEYTRYKLLLSNQGQAPSLSRLTVMSTLSQDAIPETVYAPAPWSCTLQPHSVSCQASGMVSANESLPAIEITTKLPEQASDGSNNSVRICAAVNTLLDNNLSNNEICEIMTLQQAGAVTQESADQAEDEDSAMIDNSMSENSTPESDIQEDQSSESEIADATPVTEDSPAEGNTATEEFLSEGESASANDVMQAEDSPTEDSPTEDSPTEDNSTAEEPASEEENASANDATQAEDSSTEDSPTEDNSTAAEPLSEEENASANDVAQAEDKSANQRTAVVVQIGDQEEISVEANGQVLIPVELQPRFNDTIMTVATLQIHFDSALLEPIALEPMKCGENPDKIWEIAVCNPKFEDGIMRLSVLSTAGVSGANRIAEVEFNVIGSAGTSALVTGTLISLVDENQEAISYKIQDSLVVIE